jgi:hypothetical protein
MCQSGAVPAARRRINGGAVRKKAGEKQGLLPSPPVKVQYFAKSPSFQILPDCPVRNSPIATGTVAERMMILIIPFVTGYGGLQPSLSEKEPVSGSGQDFRKSMYTIQAI